MLDSWLVEFLKGIGRFFINPLVYWIIFVSLIVSYQRIKRERNFFGSRVFDVFNEWKHTWFVACLSGLLISAILVGVGIVFSYETVLVLAAVMIGCSFIFRLTLLSPTYTVSFAFLILLFFQYIGKDQTWFSLNFSQTTNFTGLAILLGLFLIVEGVLLGKIKRNETYPSLVRSKRGEWVGQHQLKKISIVPFLMLVPSGSISPIAPYWPLLSIGDDIYGLVLFPFIIGFDFKVLAELPIHAARRIKSLTYLLALLVLALAVGSIYIPWLSLAAILLAVLAREMLNMKERIKNKKQPPYFYQESAGLKILGIIPETPAARLDISVGEKIKKVNGVPVRTSDEFYEALQLSGSFFKMDILDDSGEIRFIQGPFYEGDHYKLGFIFTTVPRQEQ